MRDLWRSRRGLSGPRRAAKVAGLAAFIALTGAGCGDLAGVRDRDLEIIYPRNGATLIDEEVLRARLRGWDLDDYVIYWYVDDSRDRRMWNDWRSRPPHKVYVVDTWFWDWRGSGPYTVGFIAEDHYGRQLAHRTVRVYVY
jgi:hypothetical protein